MKHIALTLCLLSAANAAQAACYADYKAKQDNPLKLHYGVLQLSGGCTASDAQAEATPRLQAAGWQLLNIISVFGDEGLDQRKDNAGPYFLRF